MNEPKIFQLTLAIIKPHIIKHPYFLENIRNKILSANFKVVRSKRICLSLNQAEQFYGEHKQKFFYNRLITFMTSGPSDFYILTKYNAIAEWRKLMGATKVFQTQYLDPNSIRGLYGLSDTRNATHGSDSALSAVREIKIFFPNFNVESWYKNEEYYYRNNHIKFILNQFMHVPIIENKFVKTVKI